MPECLDVGHRWRHLLKCVWRRLIGLVSVGKALLCCKFLLAQDELPMNAQLSTPSLSLDTKSNWAVIYNQKISFKNRHTPLGLNSLIRQNPLWYVCVHEGISFKVPIQKAPVQKQTPSLVWNLSCQTIEDIQKILVTWYNVLMGAWSKMDFHASHWILDPSLFVRGFSFIPPLPLFLVMIKNFSPP